MAHYFKIIQKDNLVVNTIVGPFDMDQYYAIMESIMNDKLFKPAMNMFWDFRESTLSNLNSQDIHNIRAYVERVRKRRGKNYRVVFLVSKAIDYGLSRMYQIISEDLPVKFEIFYDEEEAFKWIKKK